jgi:hypothetical protein
VDSSFLRSGKASCSPHGGRPSWQHSVFRCGHHFVGNSATAYQHSQVVRHANSDSRRGERNPVLCNCGKNFLGRATAANCDAAAELRLPPASRHLHWLDLDPVARTGQLKTVAITQGRRRRPSLREETADSAARAVNCNLPVKRTTDFPQCTRIAIPKSYKVLVQH